MSVKINENYLLLKSSYIFAEINQKVNKFQEKNPDANIIRMGIGDVTRKSKSNPSSMGNILRLMDAVNVTVNGENVVFHSQSFEEARSLKAQVVQWVPAMDNIPAEVIMPDATTVKGFCEPDCKVLAVDDEVQLERFGFARVDEINAEKIKFYFTHK